ncbi:TM2 domain-containing protein [Micromonospora viridifaciens]|uniref:hypothetical protein n=1 Tax=Micromonospora viridifaciens TaxID=1881 RepID=UPI0012FE4A16|nr:hypothetical protein [Micromonospora viridifaciens]
MPQKSAGVAVALELVLGLFGVFGVGNLYAGRTGAGVALMLSFWGLFWVNFLLIFVFIAIVTMPMTWIAYLVMGPLLAARGVERHNSGAGTHVMIGPSFRPSSREFRWRRDCSAFAERFHDWATGPCMVPSCMTKSTLPVASMSSKGLPAPGRTVADHDTD